MNTDTKPDSDPFYMFGLKLGGPDIASNIVPLWSKWPGRAQWEAMENDLLKKAKEVAGQTKGGHPFHKRLGGALEGAPEVGEPPVYA